MSTIQLKEPNEQRNSEPVSEFQTGRLTAKDRQRVRKVWIDLENSPHVPFFVPIMEELKRRDYQVLLTARDCFQVCELADLAGLEYRRIGHHYGKNRIAKVVGLAIRVLQLTPLVLRERPILSVSHVSRSSTVLSALLGIRSITISDYEHADHRLGWLGAAKKKWIMTPDVISPDIFVGHGMLRSHVLHYPGIKEDVYVPLFRPEPSLKSSLGIQPNEIMVTIRPPATEAHYHNPESERLLMSVFTLLRIHPEAKAVLVPRTHRQEDELRRAMPELFEKGRVIVPKHAVNGLDLIWHSDVVISGGGTMNREAAALGVPVYSLFRGTLGAVDKHLAETGKLVLLKSEQDVREKLQIAPRARTLTSASGQRATLKAVVDHIIAILESKG